MTVVMLRVPFKGYLSASLGRFIREATAKMHKVSFETQIGFVNLISGT